MNRLHFAKATAPPKLTLPTWWLLPFALALLNGGMALAQLVSFEAFVRAIEAYEIFSGRGATTLAVFITSAEILSLPVLLRLMLSPAMRTVSAVAVLLVPLFWLLLSLWAFVSGLQLANFGTFGAFLPQSFGWWLVLEGLAIFALSVFALHVLGLKRLSKK